MCNKIAGCKLNVLGIPDTGSVSVKTVADWVRDFLNNSVDSDMEI